VHYYERVVSAQFSEYLMKTVGEEAYLLYLATVKILTILMRTWSAS